MTKKDKLQANQRRIEKLFWKQNLKRPTDTKKGKKNDYYKHWADVKR